MQSIIAIARNTFRESLRSKILYALFFFAFVLLCLSSFFGTVTIGDQVVVVKNFGLFGISLFTLAYAAIAGTAFLHKELARKTIYNILAKPVRRSEFLLGKYAGMLATALLLSILMLPLVAFFSIALERSFDTGLVLALYGIMLQLIILCAIAIFFSAVVVTPLLSGAFTVALFLAGRSTGYLLHLLETEAVSGFGASMVKLLYIVLPHLDWLDVSDQVVYGIPVAASHLVWGTLYAICYAGILLVLGIFFFARREFN